MDILGAEYQLVIDTDYCDETLVQWVGSKMPQVTQAFKEMGCAE